MTTPVMRPARRGKRARVSRPPARTLPHVGEWRVELRGDTRGELFSRVATLIACASGRTNGTYGAWEPVALSAKDDVVLLARWANELIGRGEASGMA